MKKAISFVLLLSLMMPASSAQNQAPARTPVRRALLIPISNYDKVPRRGAENEKPAARRVAAGRGNAVTGNSATASTPRTTKVLDPLQGPPNDAKQLEALLRKRYRFTHVYVLPEAEATHDGILRAIQKYLIDEAAPGDECLLYYSGHGSWIRNSKSGQDNKQQETMVPLDYIRPITRREEVRDILDWELRAVFNRALDKGVTLTFIADSCHSGSLARGEEEIVTRAAPGSNFDLAETPPVLADPQERGLLTLTAALAEQSAYENYFGEIKQGVFTRALLDVMTNHSAEALTAEELFRRVGAHVRSKRQATQDPTIDGNNDRRKRNIFGSPVAERAERPIFTVLSFDKASQGAKLDIGRAVGLTVGSILVKQGDLSKDEDKLRLKVTAVPSMTESRAQLVKPGKVLQGDVFELESWATAAESVKVWLPPSNLSLAELRSVAKALAPLRQAEHIELINDPTEQFASHVLAYDGQAWRLHLPSGTTASLGAAPTAEAVTKRLAGSKARLFISFPLAKELRAQIKLGAGTNNSAVDVVANESAAAYKLVGRLASDGEQVEYAWILAAAFKNETEAERLAREAGRTLTTPPPSPLPPLTDWLTVGGEKPDCDLVCLALRLNRIYGWIHLQAPPETASNAFPYRLGIFDQQGKEIDPTQNVKLLGGNRYLVKLEPRPDATATESRWVYVYTIDKNGTISLIYPGEDAGQSNSFPRPNDDPGKLEAVLLTAKLDVVGPPTGVLGPETYILLTLNERLPDPVALQADGVKTPRSGERGDPPSALESLLSSINAGTRSTRVATPTSWSVQHLFLESRPK